GDQPRRPLRQVLVPAGQIEVAERTSPVGVAQHDHAPPLAVATARREAGGVEDPVDHVVADRVGFELAHGAGGAERVDEVHTVNVARAMWRGHCARIPPCRDRCLPPTPWIFSTGTSTFTIRTRRTRGTASTRRWRGMPATSSG